MSDEGDEIAETSCTAIYKDIESGLTYWCTNPADHYGVHYDSVAGMHFKMNDRTGLAYYHEKDHFLYCSCKDTRNCPLCRFRRIRRQQLEV
jgi:hypothetical protein